MVIREGLEPSTQWLKAICFLALIFSRRLFYCLFHCHSTLVYYTIIIEARFELVVKLVVKMANKKRKRYGSSYWIDPKTKLGYARVIIPQPGGKNKQIVRRAENSTHAQQIADEIRAEYADRGESYLTGRNLTFDQLAAWYEKEFLVPPRYVDGRKIAGLRTFENEKNKLIRLRSSFGNMLISEINYDVLHRYKLKRLDTGVAIATVNRDFELLRTMFRKAVRRKWLKESPFDYGERLIEKSLETRRTLTLTDKEEKLILNEARKIKRSRLYYLLLALLDTGARPSELYPVNESNEDSEITFEPVRWCDFFEHNFELVQLVSYKGKERKIRFAPVTERLKTALLELWESFDDEKKLLNDRVFPSASYKTAWRRVRSELKIENLRLRDLRRNFRTRLGKMGFSDDLAQRLLGHEQRQMTYHYAEADIEAVRQAKRLLDKNLKSKR